MLKLYVCMCRVALKSMFKDNGIVTSLKILNPINKWVVATNCAQLDGPHD
jgi:hypothetical protein